MGDGRGIPERPERETSAKRAARSNVVWYERDDLLAGVYVHAPDVLYAPFAIRFRAHNENAKKKGLTSRFRLFARSY